MLQWVKQIASFNDPGQQIDAIERNETSLEDKLEELLSMMGDYRRRSPEELQRVIALIDEILDEIETVISVVERAMDIIDDADKVERAKKLRTRLKKNRTRAQNALENAG